ncbi:MAG: mannitol dehydrogenase [Clostridia bacterium]|nr:mannitol dehydrogenase [Clostridia bacterium]
MNAVIFGAGNIGRGFIGALFSQAGLNVTFIDVSKPVVERMNADRKYPLHIVGGKEEKIIEINNVCAVDGNDREAAVNALLCADIAATCVGAKAIKYILPNFVAGIKARFAEGKAPLNLLICENLMDADEYIRELLSEQLTPEELDTVGLVETSVGRMVPVPKPTGENDNPLKIAVEEYCILPVDEAAFKGGVPEIKNMVPFTPFHYFIERKLFIHNMGHAICAYLGNILGHEYICDSIVDPNVRLLVHNAMLESCDALATRYNGPIRPLLDHANDLIRRFHNKELGDTCARVGGDIPRKLANSDRLTGAAKSCIEMGIFPVYICTGSAAALYCYMKENSLSEDSAADALISLTGLDKDNTLTLCTLEMYEYFKNGASLSEILRAADEKKHDIFGMIV